MKKILGALFVTALAAMPLQAQGTGNAGTANQQAGSTTPDQQAGKPAPTAADEAAADQSGAAAANKPAAPEGEGAGQQGTADKPTGKS